MKQRVLGWLGVVLHCTVVALFYYGSLLLAPTWAVYILWVLWAAFLLLAVYWLLHRPAWALVVPFAAAAVWFGVMGVGDWLLGWTA